MSGPAEESGVSWWERSLHWGVTDGVWGWREAGRWSPNPTKFSSTVGLLFLHWPYVKPVPPDSREKAWPGKHGFTFLLLLLMGVRSWALIVPEVMRHGSTFSLTSPSLLEKHSHPFPKRLFTVLLHLLSRSEVTSPGQTSAPLLGWIHA